MVTVMKVALFSGHTQVHFGRDFELGGSPSYASCPEMRQSTFSFCLPASGSLCVCPLYFLCFTILDFFLSLCLPCTSFDELGLIFIFLSEGSVIWLSALLLPLATQAGHTANSHVTLHCYGKGMHYYSV